MSKLQKILSAILITLLVCLLSLDTAIYRAYRINPWDIHVTTKTLGDSKIPEALREVSCIYISDLEYGSFEDPELTGKIFEKIRQLNPDLFLFGGDLFAQSADVNDLMRSQVVEWLSSIEAPLGKFAVWGEQDTFDENRMNIVRDVYAKSQIELIENDSRLITNESRSGIRLVGLSIEGDPAPVLQSLSSDQYNLLFTHDPDRLLEDSLSIAPVSYALAGNAHGTQITWPIKGGYREWPGSISLNRARQKSLSFPYYLTSGLGCLEVQARLNAPVEIVYFLFSS